MGTLDEFTVSSISHEAYTRAVARRIAMNGDSFSSVEKPGDLDFFETVTRKMAPKLVHPNRKKVRRHVMAYWEFGMKPAVRCYIPLLSSLSTFRQLSARIKACATYVSCSLDAWTSDAEDRKSTRLNSSPSCAYRMPSSACTENIHQQ